MSRLGLMDAPNSEIYATALKFTTDTVTTIGYGDIHAMTVTEKIYTCILIYFGMIIFAMIR